MRQRATLIRYLYLKFHYNLKSLYDFNVELVKTLLEDKKYL